MVHCCLRMHLCLVAIIAETISQLDDQSLNIKTILIIDESFEAFFKQTCQTFCGFSFSRVRIFCFLYHCKLNILGVWIVGRKKTFTDFTLSAVKSVMGTAAADNYLHHRFIFNELFCL